MLHRLHDLETEHMYGGLFVMSCNTDDDKFFACVKKFSENRIH